MAKYIGTYANSGDVQTALNEQELQRPFIAYTTDNEGVIFGAVGDKAEVGDIVVYSVADDLLHYIKQAEYSASTYPVADYVPVGVVVSPQADDVFSGASGEITFMGLNWLDKNNPDIGNVNSQRIEWGYDNFEIPELTNYGNVQGAITDMNGKANTEAVLQYATAQTNWRTDSAITFTNAAGYYPVFECAWRYHTSGTVQGDWYVPACGQLYFLQSNTEELAKLNAGFTAVGVPVYNFSSSARGTSTEKDLKSYAFYMHSTGISFYTKSDNGYFSTRPYCSKLMTRLK